MQPFLKRFPLPPVSISYVFSPLFFFFFSWWRSWREIICLFGNKSCVTINSLTRYKNIYINVLRIHTSGWILFWLGWFFVVVRFFLLLFLFFFSWFGRCFSITHLIFTWRLEVMQCLGWLMADQRAPAVWYLAQRSPHAQHCFIISWGMCFPLLWETGESEGVTRGLTH